MSIKGWYYLHVNGDLIYKKDHPGVVADIRESDLARALWPMHPQDRMGAWLILIEASAFGSNPERIAELAGKWGCNDSDADEFAFRAGITLSMDGNAWCATPINFTNLQEDPAGFGSTKLEAMVELAKDMGLQPSKMWGPSFVDLLSGRNKAA